MTQEFNFADSLHIWDTLLSDPEGPQVSPSNVKLMSLHCSSSGTLQAKELTHAGDSASDLLRHADSHSETLIGW